MKAVVIGTVLATAGDGNVFVVTEKRHGLNGGRGKAMASGRFEVDDSDGGAGEEATTNLMVHDSAAASVSAFSGRQKAGKKPYGCL